MDIAPEFNGGVARTFVANDKETVVYNSSTKSIECRIPAEADVSDSELLTVNPITGRINLDLVRSESKRLNLDFADNTETDGKCILSFPSENVNGQTIVSSKIVFDSVNEVIDYVEVEMIPVEGVRMITTQSNIYQNVEDRILKVGQKTVIETKYDQIEEYPEEYFESFDEIPDISEEDYRLLMEYGNGIEDENFIIGNPFDGSNIQTVIEVYENIEVNKVKDSEFRLVLGE